MTDEQFIKADAIRRDIASAEYLIEQINKSFRCKLEIDSYHGRTLDQEVEEKLSEDERLAIEFHKQEIKRIIMERFSELLEVSKTEFEAL